MTNSNPKTFLVETSLLEFDQKNPRLVAVEDIQTASDEEIMCALVKEADIGELVQSVVANGYMDIEPLIVTKKDVEAEGHYRVLEGNRRLSTIRFLQNPALAKKCELVIPSTIPLKVTKSIEKITVYLVEDEEEARAFIGFKHINGPHKWTSYAKARFVLEWYVREYDNSITIDEMAQKFGDTNSTVRSLLGGMLILRQAEEEDLFQISDRTKPGPFGFSHFYTALGRTEFREYIGLAKDWNQRPTLQPVTEDKLIALQEVLQFIYGSKKDDVASVIRSQNPDLKNLGKVLAHTVASKVLKSGATLSEAYEEVLPPSEVFQSSLIIAHQKVKIAWGNLNKASAEDSKELLNLAEEMSMNVNMIHLIMKQKAEGE